MKQTLTDSIPSSEQSCLPSDSLMKAPQESLLDLSLEDIEARLISAGTPEKKARYHARQIFKWVYQRGAQSFDEMTDLSKSLRAWLKENLSLQFLPIVFRQESTDGTRKFLFELSDGKTVESVLIPAEDRITICISSQVGCAMGCKFCNTASQGLTRNLKASEIAGQVLQLARLIDQEKALGNPWPQRHGEKITNIVYMGMGEPLHNLENLVQSIKILLAQDGLNFSKRKVTVSTSGLVPAMRKLNEKLGREYRVNLAVSLNASHDEQREEVMPVNKAFDISELLKVCREWDLEPHRRITFEYVLLGGLNDTDEDAERVVKLVRGIPSKVNVIPYNPHPTSPYNRPLDEVVNRFHHHLLNRGVSAMIRQSRGRDILAACGQLKSKFDDEAQSCN